jgi:hypothetical protein
MCKNVFPYTRLKYYEMQESNDGYSVPILFQSITEDLERVDTAMRSTYINFKISTRKPFLSLLSSVAETANTGRDYIPVGVEEGEVQHFNFVVLPSNFATKVNDGSGVYCMYYNSCFTYFF